MMTQTQFDADPSMAAKALSMIAANDDDAAELEKLEQDAMAFEIECGDFYV